MRQLRLVTGTENPYVSFFRQLLRDEATAVFSGAITAITYFVIWSVWGADAPKWLMLTALPLAAPVFEKPFLFLAYFRGAWKREGGLWKNFLDVCREEKAWRMLKADLLYHDSIFSCLMFLSTLLFFPNMGEEAPELYEILKTGQGLREVLSAGLLGVLCFGLAVGAAAALEVWVTDLQFRRFQQKLVRKYGFQQPKIYTELLYLVVDQTPSEALLQKLSSQFGLQEQGSSAHSEQELGHKLPRFNNWRPTLQIRSSNTSGRSLQVLYEMAMELSTNSERHFRCFVIRKLKWKMPLAEEQSPPIAFIQDYVKEDPKANDQTARLDYTRHYYFNPESISISVDQWTEKPSFYWIEVKAWENVSPEDLRDINEIVSTWLPAQITTHRKNAIRAIAAELDSL